MEKCYTCGKGMLRKKNVPYKLYGELIGNFDAEVCSDCGEAFFDEETSKKISRLTKSKGLWGIGAKTKIGQAGSTLDIRLPKRIIDFLHLKKGNEVTVFPESRNKLVVELDNP